VCALLARFSSGGRFHPDRCRWVRVADERFGWVTGWAGASWQRSPWAAERSDGP